MVDHGRSNYYLMTNKSGGTVTKGQTVVIDTSNNISFTTSTTAGDYRSIGVVADTLILNNGIGQIQIMGSIVPVLAASAAITRGHYIKHGTSAGKVVTTGTACAAATAPPTGAIGVALTGVGAAGNIVAYMFNTSPGVAAGATAFLGLTDVPADYTGDALKVVRVNAGETALEFAAPSGGVSAFTGLSDVPASYASQALKSVRVNAGATALEFYTPAANTSTWDTRYQPDMAPAAPNAANDEFDDDTIGAGWTAYGTPTATESAYHSFLEIKKTGTGTEAGYYEVFVPGAAAFTVACKVSGKVHEIASNQASIGVRDSGGSNIVQVGMIGVSNQIITKAAAIGGGFNVWGSTYATPNFGTVYLLINRDATTNYKVYTSHDGKNWWLLNSFSQAGTVARIYINVEPQSATEVVAQYDFVRAFSSQTLKIGNTPDANGVAALFNPDTPPTVPNTMDDEFNDASGMSGSVNGLNARWAWRNQSTSTFTFPTATHGKLTVPAAATSNHRILEQAVAAGDFSFVAKVGMTGRTVNFCSGGLVAIDRTNGDFYKLCIEVSNTTPYVYVISQRWTNVTTFGAAMNTETGPFSNVGYLRIDRVGTTINTYFSLDGVSWIRNASFTDTVTINGVGIFCNEENNTGGSAMAIDWFRRLS